MVLPPPSLVAWQIKQSLLYLQQLKGDTDLQGAVSRYSITLEQMWQRCKAEETGRILPSFHNQVAKHLRAMGAEVSTGERREMVGLPWV